MLTSSFKQKRQQQKGMAIIEMIPILIVVMLLLNFTIGFFGVIHTGILNSIAARNYAFETFRHRSNLSYFTTNTADNAKLNYTKDQLRMHTTLSDKAVGSGSHGSVTATSRTIDFFKYSTPQAEVVGNSVTAHNKEPASVADSIKYEGQGVNPVWVRTAYGICINSQCGTD